MCLFPLSDTAEAIQQAIVLGEQICDAIVAIECGNTLSSDFVHTIERMFRQLGAFRSRLVASKWQSVCSNVTHSKGLHSRGDVSLQLWDFSECVRAEMLGINVDCARQFAVTRSVSITAAAVTRPELGKGYNYWSGDQFTPGNIACFFREPMKRALLEMDEIVLDWNDATATRTCVEQIEDRCIWCCGRFLKHLKPHRQDKTTQKRLEIHPLTAGFHTIEIKKALSQKRVEGMSELLVRQHHHI